MTPDNPQASAKRSSSLFSAKGKPSSANQSSAVASGLAFIGAVVTTVTNFALAFLVLQPGLEFAGVFFAATAIIMILGNATSLGTMTALVYFLPAALEGENPSPRHLLRIALIPVLATSLIAAFGLAAVTFAIPGGGDGTDTMLRVLAPVIPALAVGVALTGATRGLGTMTPTVAINQIMRPMGQLTLIAIVTLLVDQPTHAQIAVAWGAPIVLALVAIVISTAKLGGFIGADDGPTSSQEFWLYTKPRALATAMQIALERIDVVIVKAIAGNAAASIYGAVTRFISAGVFLAFSLTQAISPNLRRSIVTDARVENADRPPKAPQIMELSTAWLILVVWPYFLLVATKADFLAGLFDVRSGSTALIIVAIGMLASTFVGPVDLGLTMSGFSRLSMVGTGLALVTNVSLNFILVPKLGIEGAAIAWSAAIMVQKVLAVVMLRRRTNLGRVSEGMLRAAGSAVVAVVPLSLLLANNLTWVIITVVLGGCIYLPLLWVQRASFGLTPEKFKTMRP